MSDDIFNNIYNKSLDLLSRREHSTKEIREKLLLRFDDCAVIDSVLTKLEKNNLISNLRFAEAYVSSRKRKGFGPKKISYELLLKGVDETTSAEIISNEGGWSEAAKNVFKKKFKEGPRQESNCLLYTSDAADE